MSMVGLQENAATGARPVAEKSEPAIQAAIQSFAFTSSHDPNGDAGYVLQPDGFLAFQGGISYGFSLVFNCFDQPMQDEASMGAIKNNSTPGRGIESAWTNHDHVTVSYGRGHRVSARAEAHRFALMKQGIDDVGRLVHGD